MAIMGRLVTASLLVACLLVSASAGSTDWSIEDATRRINLKSAWAKVIDTLTLKNTGKGAESDFIACFPAHLGPRIAVFKVLIKKEKQDVAPLQQAPAGAPDGVSCYKVTLKSAVKAGETVECDAVATITGVFKPNPSKVAQGQKQYVEFEDSKYLLSPYSVKTQTTTVVLPNSDVKSHSGGDQSGSKIKYGEFKDTSPWSSEPLLVHFQHDKPFKRVNKLVREIEVSHWGNIYVEETYEIQNVGAEHVGKFSRLTYFYSPEGKGNSFQSVLAKLPGPADALYYRDLIGNISSSDTTKGGLQTKIELRLRYPLMGSWKTDFTLGYSLPLEGFLYRRPKGKLRLITDLSTSFEDVWVEQLETRVVLPEGAQGIKASLPYEGINQSWDKKFTYLDTVGRPVLVLTKSNVVPELNKSFAVDYGFTFLAMMREPLLLIAVFACLFVAVSVCNRLDFTITKDERWEEGQARDKSKGIIQQLVAVWDSEAELLEKLIRLEHAISNDASVAAVHDQRSALETQIKGKEGQAKVLLKSLEALSPKAAEGAQAHAEKSKSIQQRAAKLLGDKADLIKKGLAPHEASDKMAPLVQQLQAATKDWTLEGARMADA